MDGRIEKLELLKIELDDIKHFKCLSDELKNEVIKYYEKEIEAIEVYGADNPMIQRRENYFPFLDEF